MVEDTVDVTEPDFRAFFRRATGFDPYPYQVRIAENGLPDLIEAPTGAGKTAAAVVPWLWRRRAHPDPAVRAATARRLIVALPMRVLVEQASDAVAGWVAAAGLDEHVTVCRLMGGEGRDHGAWLLRPEDDVIIVGTVDMVLSRALNRAYAAGRFSWPIEMGLFNNDVHWVFDEIQLLGPALATSRQLQAFRDVFTTLGPSSSTWMSATVDLGALGTVDNPAGQLSTVGVGDDDLDGGLRRRVTAPRVVREVPRAATLTEARAIGGIDEKATPRSVAEFVLERHRPGTRTLVVVNTVKRAVDIHRQLVKAAGEHELVLIHSRFRPLDRRRRVDALLDAVDPDGPGRIVVSTQVIEAGVDVSSATMITELAPWSSIVQRSGRLNRDGSEEDAELWWFRPPKAAPYDEAALARAEQVLGELEGLTVTPRDLIGIEVDDDRPTHAVLRRRDLLDLFDTAPDLTGGDVDVSRFIRETDDLDLSIAWREADGGLTPEVLAAQPRPVREELCPAPVAEARKWVDDVRDRGGAIWYQDHLDERWVAVRGADLRPGMILVADAAAGGYDPERGWDPSSRDPVSPVAPAEQPIEFESDDGVGDDPTSLQRGRWVGLGRHLGDVEDAAAVLADALLSDEVLAAAVTTAGAVHDIGKAHPVFQATMVRSASDADRARVEAGRPWAKSAGKARHARPHFRHELASALALDAAGDAVLGVRDEPWWRDLVTYLVAAHHGRVRLAIRSAPDEVGGGGDTSSVRTALGVRDGDEMPTVDTPRGTVGACTLTLDCTELGRRPDGTPSWTERALGVLDRLGPFALVYLEALVRLADWRASAAEDQGPNDLDTVPFPEGDAS